MRIGSPLEINVTKCIQARAKLVFPLLAHRCLSLLSIKKTLPCPWWIASHPAQTFAWRGIDRTDGRAYTAPERL